MSDQPIPQNLEHDPADAALVADLVALGALPPSFTRQRHPGLWDCWEARAFWARTCVSRGVALDLADALAETDRYSGQPLPALIQPPLIPDPLFDIARELRALIAEAA